MKVIEGDLVKLAKEGEFDVIVHGCNCQNIMGGGIAKQIKQEFPDAYRADEKCHRYEMNFLGNFSLGEHDNLFIINAYTQFYTGKASLPLTKDSKSNRLRAIDQVFMRIARSVPVDRKIGIPKIGAGLAGGDWDKISKIIEKQMKNHDVTVVEYKP